MNHTADDNSANPFLSTAGFGNEMKFKLRLPPFSFIHIWCRCGFWFSNLPPLGKCLYSDSMTRPFV